MRDRNLRGFWSAAGGESPVARTAPPEKTAAAGSFHDYSTSPSTHETIERGVVPGPASSSRFEKMSKGTIAVNANPAKNVPDRAASGFPHLIAGGLLLLFALREFDGLIFNDASQATRNTVLPFLTNSVVSVVASLIGTAASLVCWRYRGRNTASLSAVLFLTLTLWYCWAFNYTGGIHSERIGALGRFFGLNRKEEDALPIVGLTLLALLTIPWICRFIRSIAPTLALGLNVDLGPRACYRCDSMVSSVKHDAAVLVLLTAAGLCLGLSAAPLGMAWSASGAFGFPLFAAYYLSIFAQRPRVFFQFLPVFTAITGLFWFGWTVCFSWQALLALLLLVAVAFHACFLADFLLWRLVSVPGSFPLWWFLLTLLAERLPFGSFFLNAGLLCPTAFAALPHVTLNGLTLLLFLIPSFGLFHLVYCVGRRKGCWEFLQTNSHAIANSFVSPTLSLALCVLPLVFSRDHSDPLIPVEDIRVRTLRVSVVQGCIKGSWELRKADVLTITRTYAALTAQAYHESPFDLCVWPEYAVPGDPEADPVILQTISETARRHNITLVLGCEPRKPTADGKAHFDSALVVAPNGSVLGRYDSVRPMPLDEHVKKGLGVCLFSCPFGKFGVLICFEEGSPSLVSQYVRGGADFLVVITNHGAFDDTRGLSLALNQSRAYAIQHRIPVVRASNSGITAILDAKGACRLTLPCRVQSFGTAVIRY